MNILEEALRVTKDRPESYGLPEDNAAHIAKIASAILKREVTAKEVCVIFIATKISREMHCHKRDNLVDLAGYSYMWSRLEGEP